jgi:hypothetical protein
METHRVTTDDTTRPVVTETRVEPRPVGTPTTRAHHRDDDVEMEIPKSLNFGRDRVRWGPVLAGLVTALTSLVALSLLGAAIGLTAMNAGTAAIQGGPPPDAGRNAAIWGAISAIIAFLWGGYVAGRTSAVFDRTWGAMNGALVFLLAVPVALWLAGQGMGFLLGTMSNFASAFGVDPNQAAATAQQTAQQAANQVRPVDVARAAENTRTAAVVALLGMVAGFVASTVGGALGTRRTLEMDRTTHEVTDAT